MSSRLQELILSMNRIFVGGLKDFTPRSEIDGYFKRFGRIKKIFMPQFKSDNKKTTNSAGLDPQNYSVHGYAFIKFYKSNSAQRVLSVSHHEIFGKKIDVERAYIIDGSVNEALNKLQLKIFFRGFPSEATRGSIFFMQRIFAIYSALLVKSEVFALLRRTIN